MATTGKPEAIRLDKALFRRQKAEVPAQVISPGHALMSVIDDRAAASQDEDPVVMAFLAFIERDLKTHPGRRSRLSKASLARAVRQTKNVKVTDDETIPRNVAL
jgi:hypothetical protein